MANRPASRFRPDPGRLGYARKGPVSRVAMISVHTSPMDQPGTGDAGGLNVYVAETARRLAAAGTAVDIFTRATSGDQPRVEQLADGVTVRNIMAGPFEGLGKNELPGQLCAFTAGVLRAEAHRPEGWYDVIHSHYWLSGQVGWLAQQRWGIPLVHTMHTMARVKNRQLASGELPEPRIRDIGEQQVVDVADRLVANTSHEAAELADLYQADPRHLRVVNPGVDLQTFSPGDRQSARSALGVPQDRLLVLFVGRIQPLKAPDLLIRAVARIVQENPFLRDRLLAVICGGTSGDQTENLPELAAGLGIADLVRFEPPTGQAKLADWYRAADVLAVPSRSESFGLVAVEAQACGTPVLAAAVGGLHTAVADGISGRLVDGHDPAVWAQHLADLLLSPADRNQFGAGAVKHAQNFSLPPAPCNRYTRKRPLGRLVPRPGKRKQLRTPMAALEAG
jgi:D-inositol-3-phosphate glycosyltransferase